MIECKQVKNSFPLVKNAAKIYFLQSLILLVK